MRASGFSRHLRAPPGPGFSGCLRMWLGFYGFVRVCPDFSGFRGVTEGRHGNGFVQVSPDFSGLKGRRNDATATGFLRVSAGFSGYLRVCTGSRCILAVFPDLTSFSRFVRVFPGFSRFVRVFPVFLGFSDSTGYFSDGIATGVVRVFPGFSCFFQVFPALSMFFRRDAMATYFCKFLRVFTGFYGFLRVFVGFCVFLRVFREGAMAKCLSGFVRIWLVLLRSLRVCPGFSGFTGYRRDAMATLDGSVQTRWPLWGAP